MNLGKPIFSVLAALALVVAFVHGMPLIGILEVLLWCGLAALWTSKNWRDERLNYALLAFAAVILVAEGYALGTHAARPGVFTSKFDGVMAAPQATPSDQPIDTENERAQNKAMRDLLACYRDHKVNPNACDDQKVMLRYIKRAQGNP